MSDAPARGAPIVLRDARDQALPSRVEATHGDIVTVAKPFDIAAADPYPVGETFDVVWTEPSGVYVLPVELAATRSEGRVLLWDLAIVGEPWVDQRREFVRVPLFGRITLVPDTPDIPDTSDAPDIPDAPDTWDTPAAPASPLHGYLIDLSEAALQCCLWAGADDPRLAVGGTVRCDFTAHGARCRRDAMIHATRPAENAAETVVVIRFGQSTADADAVRRQVFAIQLRMRQTWKRRRN